MNRPCIAILLAVLSAFQACVGGLVVCLDGGCCHERMGATMPAEVVAAGDHCPDHDHAAVVSRPHADRCHCTDLDLRDVDVMRGGRDDVAAGALITIGARPESTAESAFDSASAAAPPRPGGGSAPPGLPGLQRVLRTTRLLL